MRRVHHCQLRRSDMAYGHINNVIYVSYLEEARAGMFAGRSPGQDVSALGENAVVARHRIRYLQPLVYRPEPVRIESWVSRIGRSSFTVEHEIRDDEALYCRASSIIVAFDVEIGRPRPLLPEERAVLETFLEPDPAPEPSA
jgi:acyl-CoA thioester hydrolase